MWLHCAASYVYYLVYSKFFIVMAAKHHTDLVFCRKQPGIGMVFRSILICILDCAIHRI